MSDNTTAVHCINNMGTCRSLPCHSIVMDIWAWAAQRNNWLTAAHIPGIDNTTADALSRIQETSMEWKLNENIFKNVMEHFNFTPNIDLFATRINKQINVFASYRPDPEAAYKLMPSQSTGENLTVSPLLSSERLLGTRHMGF